MHFQQVIHYLILNCHLNCRHNLYFHKFSSLYTLCRLAAFSNASIRFIRPADKTMRTANPVRYFAKRTRHACDVTSNQRPISHVTSSQFANYQTPLSSYNMLTLCLPCVALPWGQPAWQGLGFSGLVNEETHPCGFNFIQSVFKTVQTRFIDSVLIQI